MAYAQDAAIQKLITLIKDALNEKQDSGNYLTDVDVQLEQISGGAVLTINGQSITLYNGANGFSPTFRVINNNNGVTIVLTDVNGTQAFTLTDGTNGADGQNGADGFTPTITLTKNGYDITVDITNEDGTTTTTFVDGSVGYGAYPRGSASGDTITINDGADNVPVDSLTVEINPVQQASSEPASPENIRQISGFTEADVSIVGPSDSHTYTISWEDQNIVGDANGVLYGGTLDVTTGLLTITRRCLTITGDTISTSQSGVGYVRVNVGALYAIDATRRASCLSNQYHTFVGSNSGTDRIFISNDGATVYIRDARFTSVATAQSLLNQNPVQLCYYLATIRTLQLDPTQVCTFLNNNTITSNVDNIEIVYKADIGTYIDNRLNTVKAMISGVESDYIATRNYVVGELVIVEDTLLRFTTNVANGSDIIPGTNCEQTTVEQVIASSILINSVNGKTGAVVLDAEDVGAVDVNDLPLNLGANLEFVKDGINATTGDIYNSTTVYHTDYVDVSGFNTIVYTRLSTSNASSTYCSVAFYDTNNVFISSIRPIYNSVAGVMLERANIPSGVVYARFCMFESNMTSFRLYDDIQYSRALKLMGIAQAGSGGSGGTSDYEQLSNLPKINGHTLIGNQTAADIGAIDAPENPSIGDFLMYTANGWSAQTIQTYNGGSY